MCPIPGNMMLLTLLKHYIKIRVVTNNCRRHAIREVVPYFHSAMHLNLNIFTTLQIIWLLHKIHGKQFLRVSIAFLGHIKSMSY